MALRGGSSLLRSLARMTNAHTAPATRANKHQLDYSLFNQSRAHMVGDLRMFSTSPRAYNVARDLSEALNQEIAAEKEIEAKNPGASPALFPGFTVTTKEAEVRLTKKFGNESILVVFNVNHSVDIAEDYDGNEANAPVPVALPPFTIEITKGDERLCFNLELVEAETAGEYDFQVEEFYIAPAAKEGDEDVASSVYATSGKYIDPSIQDLLYVKYLEERGFDGVFLRNLVQFASSHEHHLYISFLNKMKSFITKA